MPVKGLGHCLSHSKFSINGNKRYIALLLFAHLLFPLVWQTPQRHDPFLFICVSSATIKVLSPSRCITDVCGGMDLYAFHPLASLRLCLLHSPYLELRGYPLWAWQVFLCLAPTYEAPTPKLSHSLWFITPGAPCSTWLYVAIQVAVQWCVQVLLSFWINGSLKKILPYSSKAHKVLHGAQENCSLLRF